MDLTSFCKTTAWICSFICKSLPNFSYSNLKLHNLYCHNLTSFWKTTAALGFNASFDKGSSWSRDSICWDLLTSDSSPFGFGDLVISLGWTRWRCQDLVQVPFLFRATALYFPACLGPQFLICKIHRCPFSSRSAKNNGILLPKLFWPTVRKNCEIQGWRPRICRIFEITWTIYSNSERSEQFLVTECFFNLFPEVIIQIGKHYWDLEISRKS